LECFDPPPSTAVLADWTARLGQELFYPPNVGGWKGGRHWLSPQAIIGRANFAAALVEGKLHTTFDGLDLAKGHGKASDLDSLLSFYAGLLTGSAPSPKWRNRLREALGPQADVTTQATNLAVALMLASPEGQLA